VDVQQVLQDSGFYKLLLQCDQDLASKTREAGCFCGGQLHSAVYPRKPRGGPPGLDAEYEQRLSFCCAKEGCRRRRTPPSLLFLERRVYYGVIVVLISALREGRDSCLVQLQKQLGIDRTTLSRWRLWWRQWFPQSSFWKSVRGRFIPPVTTRLLPQSLLDQFKDCNFQDKVIALLNFISPLTTSSAVA
jgi:hypothetical protein